MSVMTKCQRRDFLRHYGRANEFMRYRMLTNLGITHETVEMWEAGTDVPLPKKVEQKSQHAERVRKGMFRYWRRRKEMRGQA